MDLFCSSAPTLLRLLGTRALANTHGALPKHDTGLVLCHGGCSAGHQGVGRAFKVVLRGSSPGQSCSALPACVGGAFSSEKSTATDLQKGCLKRWCWRLWDRPDLLSPNVTAGKMQKTHASTQAA